MVTLVLRGNRRVILHGIFGQNSPPWSKPLSWDSKVAHWPDSCVSSEDIKHFCCMTRSTIRQLSGFLAGRLSASTLLMYFLPPTQWFIRYLQSVQGNLRVNSQEKHVMNNQKNSVSEKGYCDISIKKTYFWNSLFLAKYVYTLLTHNFMVWVFVSLSASYTPTSFHRFQVRCLHFIAGPCLSFASGKRKLR